MHLKNEVRTTLADYKSPTGVYVRGERCWNVETQVDIALPCATQNEVHLNDAKGLAAKGCKVILEGANMPTTNDAIQYFHSKDVVLAPAKACNAGMRATRGGGGGGE